MNYSPVVSRGLRGGYGAPSFHGLFRRFGARMSSDIGGHRSFDRMSMCDAILRTRSKVGTAAKMREEAKKPLGHALQAEELHLKNIRGDFVVGNLRGLDLMNYCEGLDTKLASMNQTITSLKESFEGKICLLETTIAALKASFTTLKASSANQERTLTALQASSATLKASSADQERTLTALQASSATLKASLADQERTLTVLQASSVTLKASSANQRKAIADQGKAIADQEKAITDQGKATTDQGIAITTLNKKIDQQNIVHEITNCSQDEQLHDLAQSLPFFRKMRNRFISTFRRNCLHNETKADRKIIADDNPSVHGGNAAMDALLYCGPEATRKDRSVFKQLYGLSPEVVGKIKHKPTIHLLNIHATIRASDRRTASKEFYRRFREFIEAFMSSNYDVTYLDGNISTLTLAYWAFAHSRRTSEVKQLKRHKKHQRVTVVNPTKGREGKST